MDATTECTRCGNGFMTNNSFLMTCSICYKHDIDFTIELGNQVRILQINVTLMNLSIEICHIRILDDRKLVLEKLVAQLEPEKQELSKNV
jgi:hypothetical protein